MVRHWKVCPSCFVFAKSKSTETVGQKYEKAESNLEAKQKSPEEAFMFPFESLEDTM